MHPPQGDKKFKTGARLTGGAGTMGVGGNSSAKYKSLGEGRFGRFWWGWAGAQSGSTGGETTMGYPTRRWLSYSENRSPGWSTAV